VHTGFWWGNLGERDNLEDTGVKGNILLIRIFKNWVRGMDWFQLAQDRNRWRARVDAVMNFLVV